MDAVEIILEGRIDPLNVSILLAVSAAALLLAYRLYQHRDILI